MNHNSQAKPECIPSKFSSSHLEFFGLIWLSHHQEWDFSSPFFFILQPLVSPTDDIKGSNLTGRYILQLNRFPWIQLVISLTIVMSYVSDPARNSSCWRICRILQWHQSLIWGTVHLIWQEIFEALLIESFKVYPWFLQYEEPTFGVKNALENEIKVSQILETT